MKRLAFCFALAFALIALSPPDGYAKMIANYSAIKLGGFFPMASDVDDFDTGFDAELAFGHYVMPGLAIEGGLGYFKTKGERVVSIPGSGSFLANEDIRVIPLTVSIKGVVPAGRFEPYGMIGLGVYFVSDKIRNRGTEDDTELGLHVGFGGNYNLTPQVFLGLEAKYLLFKADLLGTDVRLDGVNVTGNLGMRF